MAGVNTATKPDGFDANGDAPMHQMQINGQHLQVSYVIDHVFEVPFDCLESFAHLGLLP